MLKVLVFVGLALFVLLVTVAIVRRQDTGGRPAPRLRSSSDHRPVQPSGSHSSVNWLVGLGGDVEGRTFHVGGRVVTLGRGVSNYIQTTDGNASRVHCQFSPVPYGLQVIDMGSSNGTLVNGEPIEVQVLKDGDIVEIGEVTLRYHKQGDFRRNDALERKSVGQQTENPTQFIDANKSLGQLARVALESTGGDVEAAAQKMGVSREVFQQLLK